MGYNNREYLSVTKVPELNVDPDYQNSLRELYKALRDRIDFAGDLPWPPPSRFKYFKGIPFFVPFGSTSYGNLSLVTAQEIRIDPISHDFPYHTSGVRSIALYLDHIEQLMEITAIYRHTPIISETNLRAEEEKRVRYSLQHNIIGIDPVAFFIQASPGFLFTLSTQGRLNLNTPAGVDVATRRIQTWEAIDHRPTFTP